MKGRSLALFLLVYLTLDVGNPFMPGAVTFVDGGLQVIDAGRPAALDLPMPAASIHAVAAGDDDPSPPSPDVAGGPPPRARWIPPRRAFAAAADPAPAPDDH